MKMMRQGKNERRLDDETGKSVTELSSRILVALVAVPLILWVSFEGGVLFFFFIALVSCVGLWELYKLMEQKGIFPAKTLGLAGGFAVSFSFIFGRLQFTLLEFAIRSRLSLPLPTPRQLLVILILVFIAAVLLYELFRKRGSPTANASATIFGVLYVSLFLGTLIGLRELFVPGDFPAYRYFQLQGAFVTPEIAQKVYDWGGYTVASIFAILWISDSAAFFGGKLLGKHKLMERVSPNKTWEGAAFGFFFAVIAAVWARFFVLDYLSYPQAIVLGLLVGVFGQMGDLFESRLKRDAGVKDSSHLIPGHGGVLDRFDGLILISPLVYLYLDRVRLRSAPRLKRSSRGRVLCST